MSCVAHLTNDWKAETLITENEKDVIQSCAGQANDKDGDEVLDIVDNCAENCNALQLDGNSDGIGDVCDVCDRTPGCGGCKHSASEGYC